MSTCVYLVLIVCSFCIMYSSVVMVHAYLEGQWTGSWTVQMQKQKRECKWGNLAFWPRQSPDCLHRSLSCQLVSEWGEITLSGNGAVEKGQSVFLPETLKWNNKKIKKENVRVCGVGLDVAGNPCWPAFHPLSLVDWFRLRPHWLTSIDSSGWGNSETLPGGNCSWVANSLDLGSSLVTPAVMHTKLSSVDGNWGLELYFRNCSTHGFQNTALILIRRMASLIIMNRIMHVCSPS